MNRALAYLLYSQKVNGAIEFVRSLKRPKKALAFLFWLALIGLMIAAQLAGGVARSPDRAADSVRALLSVMLLLSVVGGFLQRGLAFQPSDVDFLFPGPFHRHELVLYRLFSLYTLSLISSLFLTVFLVPQTAAPGRTFVAVLLCQLVALHLQTISGLLAAAIESRTFEKMRRSLQIVFVVLSAGGIVYFLSTVLGSLSFARGLRGLVELPWLRKALVPAAWAGELSVAATWSDAARPLLLLGGWILGSLGLVLLLQVDFLEASISTSQRVQRYLQRSSRGYLAAATSEEDARRRTHRGLQMFSGALALTWKNLIAASRSLKVLFSGLIVAGLFATVMIAMGHAVDEEHAAEATVKVLALGQLIPLMLHQYVAFDFRRDFESIVVLKQLPMAPIAVAFAEVLVPTMLALLFQWAIVGTWAALTPAPVSAWVFAVVLIGYPLFTCAAVTIANFSFMLYPVRVVSAGGRPNVGGASVNSLLNVLMLLITMAPALTLAYIALAYTGRPAVAIATMGAMQLGMDLLLLWWLGQLFANFDVSRGTEG